MKTIFTVSLVFTLNFFYCIVLYFIYNTITSLLFELTIYFRHLTFIKARVKFSLSLTLAIQGVHLLLVGWQQQQISTTNHYVHITQKIQTQYLHTHYVSYLTTEKINTNR